MARDAVRIDSVQAFLREASLDAVVCSLPLNVLLLTGYWPVVGKSLAVAVRGGPTVLLVPEDERELAEGGGADEVRTFAPHPSTIFARRKAPFASRSPTSPGRWESRAAPSATRRATSPCRPLTRPCTCTGR